MDNNKSVYKIAKVKYFAKVLTCSKSPDHVLQTNLVSVELTETTKHLMEQNGLFLRIMKLR